MTSDHSAVVEHVLKQDHEARSTREHQAWAPVTGCILASLELNNPLHCHRCPPAQHRVQTSKDLISILKMEVKRLWGSLGGDGAAGGGEGCCGRLAKAGVEVRSSSDCTANI